MDQKAAGFLHHNKIGQWADSQWSDSQKPIGQTASGLWPTKIGHVDRVIVSKLFESFLNSTLLLFLLRVSVR